MKWYVKQKIKQKIKLYLTHVSVWRMKEQHGETKRSVKRRKKEICNKWALERSSKYTLVKIYSIWGTIFPCMWIFLLLFMFSNISTHLLDFYEDIFQNCCPFVVDIRLTGGNINNLLKTLPEILSSCCGEWDLSSWICFQTDRHHHQFGPML